MPQSHSNSDTPKTILQPPCPDCGLPMWMMRLSALGKNQDVRMFQCQVCNHTDTVLVER
jgi:hypothetical protein